VLITASAIILLFSCVSPGVKLAALGWLWFAPTVGENRRRSLRIIEPLGKWSMLDVLVVILFAGVVKLGLIADATVLDGACLFALALCIGLIRLADMATIEPRIGLYCFAAVVLTPIVSFRLRALHKRA
jgi:paraquat-inducible protein A